MTDSPTSKFRKVNYEQYYTPWDTAHVLYDTTLLIVGDAFDNFVEPSAGKGAFLACMPPDKRIGIDIEPWGWHYGSVGKDIEEQDFFNFIWPEGRTITIGNPPFGRKGKLAMQFLNISSENSEIVAFILPSIFSKYTFINRVHPMMHLIHEVPVTEFDSPDGIGEGPKVNCVFQIWEKSTELRPKIVKPTSCDDFDMIHRHFSRTSPDERERLKSYDFAISQIEGKIRNCEDVTAGSVYFIKDNTPDKSVRSVMERVDFSDLSKHHVGATSLTKADIVEGYLINIENNTP